MHSERRDAVCVLKCDLVYYSFFGSYLFYFMRVCVGWSRCPDVMDLNLHDDIFKDIFDVDTCTRMCSPAVFDCQDITKVRCFRQTPVVP